MKEITDKDLAAIRSNLSACNPLVQSLVRRLDRVEGENVRWEQSSDRHLGNLLREKGKCADCVISDGAWSERALTAEAESTALRLRAETAEKDAAEAYAKGQMDMREAAAKEADQWTGCDLLAKEIRALPIKERP